MHGTNLNSLIRTLLKNTVLKEEVVGFKSLFDQMDSIKVAKSEKWTREELYER